MPFDLPAEHVLPLLKSRDGDWALHARAAWDFLTASGDVPVVNLRGLEYFLSYQPPAKFLSTLDEHREVAIALGGLLGDLGYEDSAAVCGTPVNCPFCQTPLGGRAVAANRPRGMAGPRPASDGIRVRRGSGHPLAPGYCTPAVTPMRALQVPR